jgi:hypothetical protein
MTAPLLDKTAAIEAVLVEYREERIPIHGASAAIADLMGIEAHAAAARYRRAWEEDRDPCESCGEPAFREDPEGVPLCDGCADAPARLLVTATLADLEESLEADLEAAIANGSTALAVFRFAHVTGPERSVAVDFADLAVQIVGKTEGPDRALALGALSESLAWALSAARR